jgi:heme-degrading monooxygenase HmoA
VKPDLVEDFVQDMREKIYPDLRKKTGIRRMYLLRSRGDGRELVSLTFWNSKAEADRYGESAFRNNIEALRDYLESDPIVTEYDVDYHDVNAEDLPPPETAKEIVERNLASSMRKAKSKGKKSKKKSGKRSR